jgi:hypothetical protein
LGEVYKSDGWNEIANINVVDTVCAPLGELRFCADGKP